MFFYFPAFLIISSREAQYETFFEEGGIPDIIISFLDKYGIWTNQWTCLYQALMKVSMNKIALWIRVFADDWASKSAIKANNVHRISKMPNSYKAYIFWFQTYFDLRKIHMLLF